MTIPVIPVPVDHLTEPPSTSDSANFDARGDAFLGALPEFGDQMNDLADDTYQNAVSASESAVSALANKDATSNYVITVQSLETQTAAHKASAQAAALAAQSAAGLPALKDGGVLTCVGGGVVFERVRGEKQMRSQSFTAQTGKSYAVNTIAGAVTMTLPSNPNPFTSIELSDYGQVAHKNKITIAQNGVTEIAKTNILLQSKNLFVSPWENAPSSGFTVTQSTDISAPNGIMGNVTKYVAASPAQQLFTRQTGLTVASASTRMVSMYVFVPSGQVANYSLEFDYNDVDTASVSSTVFDQWVRLSALITTTAARDTLNVRVNVNTGSTPSIGFTMYAGFAQDEADTLTSFITTTASAVTRAAGVFNYPINFKASNFVFDVKGGTCVLEFINEFKGWQITGLQTRDDINFYDNGTSGAFNYLNGQHQLWSPTAGAQTVSFANWADTGIRSEFVIEGVNLGAATITFPTIQWLKSDGTFTTTFASLGITLATSGRDFILFWTRDGGTTIYAKVMR